MSMDEKIVYESLLQQKEFNNSVPEILIHETDIYILMAVKSSYFFKIDGCKLLGYFENLQVDDVIFIRMRLCLENTASIQFYEP